MKEKEKFTIEIRPDQVDVFIITIHAIQHLLSQTCDEKAETITQGATFMTGTREDIYNIGGIEALAGFGMTLEGMKAEIIDGAKKEIEKSWKKKNDQN